MTQPASGLTEESAHPRDNQSAEIENCEECGKSHFMVGDDPHNRTRHYPYIPNPKRRQRDELDEILTLINYRKIKTKDAKARIEALSESRAIEAHEKGYQEGADAVRALWDESDETAKELKERI